MSNLLCGNTIHFIVMIYLYKWKLLFHFYLHFNLKILNSLIFRDQAGSYKCSLHDEWYMLTLIKFFFTLCFLISLTTVQGSSFHASQNVSKIAWGDITCINMIHNFIMKEDKITMNQAKSELFLMLIFIVSKIAVTVRRIDFFLCLNFFSFI